MTPLEIILIATLAATIAALVVARIDIRFLRDVVQSKNEDIATLRLDRKNEEKALTILRSKIRELIE